MDEEESVYNRGATNNKIKPNVSKFQLKNKPSIIFNINKTNGGSPPPKKLKLTTVSDKPCTITSSSHSNGNTNGSNGINLNGTSNNIKFGKPKINLFEQRRKLPIFANRNRLLGLIKSNDTLVIVAETGCGKTTQIPQYIHSARLEENGCIAVTQPRRVAAISLAKRVAQENCQSMEVGETVGYTVRFEDKTSARTKIKYMTDGMLLREAMFDKLLMNYTFIILDEAHERTIHTDVLFGIVKEAQKKRKERNITPLKILIMSATIDVESFTSYFNNCKSVYIEGRTYPVTLFYMSNPNDDYPTTCVSTFFKIHREAPPDYDVLIFLTGQEEIETAAQQIRILAKDPDVEGPPVKVFTLYAAQASAQQLSVFQSVPEGHRKVIISTNIAETSITISGIRYIIDSGMVKVRSFHPSTGLEMLKVQRISQEQAWQRLGRAGRDSEGYCYRLYTRSQFESMSMSTEPEIQRANLTSVVLQLLALGVHAKKFDFMSKPSEEALDAAFEELKLLGAVEDVESGKLTEIGQKMTKFPLDPKFTKIILAAEKFGCVAEALTAVSFLSAESVLLNPTTRKEQAQAVRQKFHSTEGDLLTLINIFREFSNAGKSNKKAWCHEHFLNLRNMLYVKDVRTQLKEICRKCNIEINSCSNQLKLLRKSLLAGLFMNVAEFNIRDRHYSTLHKKQKAWIHPSSVLHGTSNTLVLFTEIVQTSKCFLRGLTTMESDWLMEVAPEYFKQKNIRTSDKC
ncbi:ATP-dependent RNA helicase DHX33-like [Coccinella septempunctata]|uniref:ATP-dependent RNA helicase DHX33-like n=1 Tax=Coccinella septempunctata TaxID=41139 RepID=UPI001D071973|nr:ATP-dependent RNA helicase DHX33-like [Coccinella septempunctata]